MKREQLITLTHGGLTLSLREWAERPEVVTLGISLDILRNRHAAGWPDERALTTAAAARKHWGVGLDAPYLEDLEARRFVLAHPDGATREEVGEALGVPTSTIAYIEEKALRRLEKRAQLAKLNRLLDRYERELARARADVAELARDVEDLAGDLSTLSTLSSREAAA